MVPLTVAARRDLKNILLGVLERGDAEGLDAVLPFDVEAAVLLLAVGPAVLLVLEVVAEVVLLEDVFAALPNAEEVAPVGEDQLALAVEVALVEVAFGKGAYRCT